MTRRFLAKPLLLVAALGAIASSAFIIGGVAQADGLAHCSAPHVPDPGPTWVTYDGTATCAYGDTTGLATVRANLKLRQGNGARFRPDTWYTIDETGYSSWFAYNSSRYLSGFIYCSDVPYTGDFRGRMRYELHWTDDHLTYHNWESSTVDSQC